MKKKMKMMMVRPVTGLLAAKLPSMVMRSQKKARKGTAARVVDEKQSSVASPKPGRQRKRRSRGQAKVCKDDDDDDDEEKPSRNMFHGATSSLTLALAPLVKQTRFIKYHEQGNGNKLDKHLIRKQAAFLRALHSVYAPLCFTQKQMQEAVAAVGASKSWFEQQPTVMTEWSQVQARRLRTMCRHFSQAAGKARGRNSSWVHLILQA